MIYNWKEKEKIHTSGIMSFGLIITINFLRYGILLSLQKFWGEELCKKVTGLHIYDT